MCEHAGVCACVFKAWKGRRGGALVIIARQLPRNEALVRTKKGTDDTRAHTTTTAVTTTHTQLRRRKEEKLSEKRRTNTRTMQLLQRARTEREGCNLQQLQSFANLLGMVLGRGGGEGLAQRCLSEIWAQ